MKNFKTTDIMLMMAALILLGVLALYLKPSVSADAVALLSVSAPAGPCCPSCRSSSFGDCDRCSAKVANSLYGKNGIAWVRKETGNGNLLVAYDSQVTSPEAIASAVTGSGFSNLIGGTMNMNEYCARAENLPATLLRKSACGGLCGMKEK